MDFEKPGFPPESSSIAIVALTRHGADLALQLQGKLPGSACYVPVRHQFALAMGAVGFQRMADLLREIWPRVSALVCIMATGIVVRQISPYLRHKKEDPAVVVLDERGEYVISLVSGHLGGANRLTKEVARITGGHAVITTASDVQDKPALDLMARAAGLEIENIEMLSRLARAFLEDEPVWIYDPEGRLKRDLAGQGNIDWLHEVLSSPPSLISTLMERVGVWVSEALVPAFLKCLVLRPRNLVVGIGCNRGTPAQEIMEWLQRVFAREKLSPLSIRNLVSVDLKSDEAGIIETAAMLQRPVHFYSRKEIENITVPNPSTQVAKHIGVQSVCEATALLSAGSQTLIVPKQKTFNVTLAIARVGYPL